MPKRGSSMIVRKNDKPNAAEMRIRRAIHTLQDACNDDVILMQDPNHDVYLVPAILGEDSSEDKAAGTVEYQVSDGLPGHRGTSLDFYILAEAIECFTLISKIGWGAYFARNKEKIGNVLKTDR